MDRHSLMKCWTFSVSGVRLPLSVQNVLRSIWELRRRIYYKNESVSPPGSHKPNTAVAQAYYNQLEGIHTLTTETGAGQWGSALSFACNYFDITCTVFMVKVSYEQKPYRKSLMNTWGGVVYPSPTNMTNSGRKILEMDPDCPGSLGIAISEAVEWLRRTRRQNTRSAAY